MDAVRNAVDLHVEIKEGKLRLMFMSNCFTIEMTGNAESLSFPLTLTLIV